MTEFELFIKKNALKKKEIAEFIGTSNAFITQLCQGLSPLPADKLKKIKENTSWDTSMLSYGEKTSIIAGNNNAGDVNVQIGQNLASGDARSSGDPNIASRLAVLEKENEMLRERIKDKDDQLAFLKTLINK